MFVHVDAVLTFDQKWFYPSRNEIHLHAPQFEVKSTHNKGKYGINGNSANQNGWSVHAKCI